MGLNDVKKSLTLSRSLGTTGPRESSKNLRQSQK